VIEFRNENILVSTLEHKRITLEHSLSSDYKLTAVSGLGRNKRYKNADLIGTFFELTHAKYHKVVAKALCAY
jgi:hypothetical protein